MHRWSECECVKTHTQFRFLPLIIQLFSGFKLITFIVCLSFLFSVVTSRSKPTSISVFWFTTGKNISRTQKVIVWRWRSSQGVLLWGFWWKWIEADGNRGTNRERSINRETYWENERQIKDKVKEIWNERESERASNFTISDILSFSSPPSFPLIIRMCELSVFTESHYDPPDSIWERLLNMVTVGFIYKFRVVFFKSCSLI